MEKTERFELLKKNVDKLGKKMPFFKFYPNMFEIGYGNTAIPFAPIAQQYYYTTPNYNYNTYGTAQHYTMGAIVDRTYNTVPVQYTTIVDPAAPYYNYDYNTTARPYAPAARLPNYELVETT